MIVLSSLIFILYDILEGMSLGLTLGGWNLFITILLTTWPKKLLDDRRAVEFITISLYLWPSTSTFIASLYYHLFLLLYSLKKTFLLWVVGAPSLDGQLWVEQVPTPHIFLVIGSTNILYLFIFLIMKKLFILFLNIFIIIHNKLSSWFSHD